MPWLMAPRARLRCASPGPYLRPLSIPPPPRLILQQSEGGLRGLCPGSWSPSGALPLRHGHLGLASTPGLHTGGEGSEAKGRPSRLPICLSRSAASSGVARGRTPGSLKLVRSRVPITKKNRMPPTTGMAGVSFTARYGQLPTGWAGRRGGEKERKDNVSNQQ